MEFMIQNICNNMSTNKLMQMLYISNSLSKMCLQVLCNRRIHFSAGMNENMVNDILRKYNFNYVDLSNTEKLSDNTIELLKNRRAVFLEGVKNISTKSLIKLNNCNILDLSGTNVSSDAVKEMNNVRHLRVAYSQHINNSTITNLLNNNNIIHTLDLTGTNVDNDCLNELRRCHQCCIEYTNMTDDNIKLVGVSWKCET